MTVVYSRINIALHWLMALLMGAGYVLGQLLDDIPRGPDRTLVVSIHALIGIAILALVLPRLAALRVWGPRHQRLEKLADLAARLGHLGLYGVMAGLPLSGLVMVAFSRQPLKLFGSLPLPHIAEDHELHGVLLTIHAGLGALLLVLLAAHIGATVWHHVVLRDDVAGRMLPFLRKPAAMTPDTRPVPVDAGRATT